MKFSIYGFLFLAFVSSRALAFPENIRHGYVNCNSCHISPSGGGILNDYGRSLSKELMSTWAVDGEEAFAYGLVAAPSWLKFGGDVRALQTFLDSPQVHQADNFLMQANLAAAADVGKLTFVATAGVQGGPSTVPNRGTFLSDNHYVLLHATDELAVRAGRFRFNYGVNEANHTRFIKRGLGWDEGTETYNLETSYSGEKYTAFLTAILGRIDTVDKDIERGYAITGDSNLYDSMKVGLSTYLGENSVRRRNVSGAYALIGFTKNLVWISELDYQQQFSKGSTPQTLTVGVVTMNKITYEVYKGINPYLIHELSYLNFDRVSSRSDNYGIGLDLFPRPHFELAAEYTKQRSLSRGDYYSDSTWLLGHYYF